MTQTPLLLQTLFGQPTSRPPIWLMRQAGRYLPEYQQIRALAGSFNTLYRTPKLATEVTLQPLKRFALDAAIIFSDILTVPEAYGHRVDYVHGLGPQIQHPLQTPHAIAQLTPPSVDDAFDYLFEAIALCRQSLPQEIALIGFAGAPWTLACYFVEGGSSRHFATLKTLMYQHPEALMALLDHLTETVTAMALAQIRAGAQVIQLFDSWAGILSEAHYQTFALSPLMKIVSALKTHAPQTPVILFSKGSSVWLPRLSQCPVDALSLDWQMDLPSARTQVRADCVLQGNLDPMLLFAPLAVVEQETRALLESMSDDPRFIVNLGHGILPKTPIEAVRRLVDTVTTWQRSKT